MIGADGQHRGNHEIQPQPNFGDEENEREATAEEKSTSGYEGMQSWEDLYQLLSRDDAKNIDVYRQTGNPLDLKSITRQKGLRAKVAELFEKFPDWEAKPDPNETIRTINREKLVKKVPTIEELKAAIEIFKNVQGSEHKYSADELNTLIDQVAAGQRSIQEITNTHGIRDKLKELMQNKPRRLSSPKWQKQKF